MNISYHKQQASHYSFLWRFSLKMQEPDNIPIALFKLSPYTGLAVLITFQYNNSTTYKKQNLSQYFEASVDNTHIAKFQQSRTSGMSVFVISSNLLAL